MAGFPATTLNFLRGRNAIAYSGLTGLKACWKKAYDNGDPSGTFSLYDIAQKCIAYKRFSAICKGNCRRDDRKSAGLRSAF